MDSSLVVAFRAFVMLACLVLVPLAAIFGSAFPDVVKSVLIDRFLPREAQHTGATHVAEAPRFGGANSASLYSAQPQTAPLQRRAGDAFQNSSAPREVQQAAAWSPTAQSPFSQPGGTNVPVAQIPDNRSPAASSSEAPPWPGNTNSDWRGGGSPASGAVVMQQQATPQYASPMPSAAAPIPENSVQTQSERFSAMEQHLRQGGALYYRLESWGNAPGLYRFHCRMPIAGNVNVTQNFEATDKDALQAMSRVVAQVDQWRAGR